MKRRAILILGFVALGILIRLQVTFKESPDCVYHLRRAHFALHDFPKTILFDPMIHFPEGGICIWPPLFDLTLATPALLFHGPQASKAFLEQTAMWIPIIFAAGAIAAAGAAGLALHKRWGVAAALFVAICPGQLQYSQFGHTDQHVAESFFGFLCLALFLWSFRKPSRWLDFATGSALALAVLTWQGSIFWAAILAFGLFVEILAESERSHVTRTFLILGMPALLTAVATAYWTHGFQMPFTYVSFGWFQPVFLSAVFGFVMMVLILRKIREWKTSNRIVALALLIASVSPLIFLAQPLFSAVGYGILHLAVASKGSGIVHGGFLSYPSDWLAQIVEYRPLLADGWLWPLGFLSPAFFLSPFVMILWAKRAINRNNPALHATLFFWGLFIFLFTLSQRRNVYYASLLAAVTAIEVALFIGKRVSKDKPWVIAVILGIQMAPMLFQLPKELQNDYSAGSERLQTLAEIKKIMPQELDIYDRRFLTPQIKIPESRDAHSVLAFWSQGHLVTYFAERPVVADNFGYDFLESLRFFLATNEEDAIQIAKAHRVKFVLSLDLITVINRYAHALHAPDLIERSGQKWIPKPTYFQTLQARMHDFDGQGEILPGGIEIEPLRHFRLRYASATGSQRFGRKISQFKIFEVVE